MTINGVAPVLRLGGVGKTYRRGDEQVKVLTDLDFALDAGEFDTLHQLGQAY